MSDTPLRPHPLGEGDFAPWFTAQPSMADPIGRSAAAGAIIVLFFLGSAGNPRIAAALATMLSRSALFDDQHASFFGLTVDREDAVTGRIAQRVPGTRYCLD